LLVAERESRRARAREMFARVAGFPAIKTLDLGRDTFRPLPSFCDGYDVTIPILIRMFVSKFEAQRRLILNAFFLFLATCLRLIGRPDVPFVE
jgi:hypothetical protein